MSCAYAELSLPDARGANYEPPLPECFYGLDVRLLLHIASAQYSALHLVPSQRYWGVLASDIKPSECVQFVWCVRKVEASIRSLVRHHISNSSPPML